MRRLSLFLLALCFPLLSLLAASSPAAEADSLFAQKNYVAASAAYASLIQDQGVSVNRLFNLGNSYYQQGQLGRAMLAYERAQLLDPRDKALREVRAFLARKTVDRLPAPDGWVRQTGDAVAYALPFGVWAVLCPLFFALSLAGWVIFALSETPRLKRLSFYPALASLGLFLLSGALLAHWLYGPRLAEDRAVVLLPEVSVYAEPNEGAAEVTKLHEGARIQLLGKSYGSFERMELPDGQHGWIARRTLETIAPIPGLSPNK